MEILTNPGFALFLFGALLLATGLLGGGLEISVLKIPKIDGRPRLLAGGAGMVFTGLGTLLLLTGLPTGPAPPPPPSATVATSGPGAGPPATAGPVATQPAAVTFTIHDQLGSAQESEQLMVFIDGQYAGELRVDSGRATAMLTAQVAEPGSHHYRITGRAIMYTTEGAFAFDLYGDGAIDVQQGKGFYVAQVTDEVVNPLPVTLAE